MELKENFRGRVQFIAGQIKDSSATPKDIYGDQEVLHFRCAGGQMSMVVKADTQSDQDGETAEQIAEYFPGSYLLKPEV